MNKKLKKTGLIALGIAVVAIPLALIARKMMKAKCEDEQQSEEYKAAAVFPAYRKKDRVHNRKEQSSAD